MRIDLNHEAQPLPESERSGESASAGAGGSLAAASALGQDQAQLSGEHAQIQALAAQASQLPEVRHERVQALRQLVAGGNYRPAPDDVASAMIADMVVDQAA